jgi:hypothetical protein
MVNPKYSELTYLLRTKRHLVVKNKSEVTCSNSEAAASIAAQTWVRLEHEEHRRIDLREVEYWTRLECVWLRMGTVAGLL